MEYRIIGTVLLCAGITFVLRALPFLIFSGDREMPVGLSELGRKLPMVSMAVLVIYCLKDIYGSFLGVGKWQLVSAVVVAVSYKWKHSTFISIVAGTAAYMILIRI